MVTARLFLAPLLAGLSGRDPHSALIWRQAVLARGLEPCGERETFHRGRWTKRACVAPLDDQDSSAQRALAMADVLIHRPAGARLAKPGYVVPILAL
jgi:molybdopterin molybdotransferase